MLCAFLTCQYNHGVDGDWRLSCLWCLGWRWGYVTSYFAERLEVEGTKELNDALVDNRSMRINKMWNSFSRMSHFEIASFSVFYLRKFVETARAS